ncbi:hypothetical protein P885DRAFT_77279 [Corynascus similis CBS 632.67]
MGNLAGEANGHSTTTETGGVTATTDARTVLAIMAEIGIGIGTIGDTDRAPETEATVDAPDRPAASADTTGAMQIARGTGTGREAIDGARTTAQSHHGRAAIGAKGGILTVWTEVTSPMSPRHLDGHSQLPTRSKPNGSTSGAAPVPAAPVSFKVKGRDGSHGPEPRQQSTSTRENSQEHQQQHEDGERQQSRGRFDAEPMDEDEVEDVVVEDDGLDDMAAMMGFGGFGTTKGKKVLGNNVGAARKEKKTQYRQYMNRVGGFNRPLSPTR